MMTPGIILLLGSGETSPTGGRVFEKLMNGMFASPVISILETPAGFELNSRKVAERVGNFLETRLQNNRPKINIIPARKKGTAFSPDDAEILKPLLTSNVIYMGAGSPTYTIRQLEGSLAWELVRARHARGAAIVLASAAIIAAGVQALPVYEIFKVGQDPFWVEGLDLLGAYGLPLVFVPHWNNQEGGADLDTSRCYLGEKRFFPLLQRLKAGVKVVGLDELTALWIDFSDQTCEVMGLGSLYLLDQDGQEDFVSGSRLPLIRLGNYRPVEDILPGVSTDVWNEVAATDDRMQEKHTHPVPEEVLRLVAERQSARDGNEWQRADDIRREIEKAGWQVKDTPTGPRLEFLKPDY
ncbi:MAG: cysteinyl-tRNA synthetase [Anaerolineaceae bacterium]